MTAEARRTLAVIRACLASDRYAVTVHFAQRMALRLLFRADVEAVMDDPADVRSLGTDEYNRPKWAVRGDATIGDDIEIICAVETDDAGTEFITLYWRD